jgi:hypothetical protein
LSGGGALSLPLLYAQVIPKLSFSIALLDMSSPHKLKSLQAAKAVATGVLTAAVAVMKGGTIAADQAALEAARKALSVAQATGADAVRGAQSSLRLTDEATAAAINAAQNAVAIAQTGPEAIAYKAAQQAMASFQTAGAATLKAAQGV